MAESPKSTSALKIEEAISRSREIVEESKALTLKNSQRKALLEERYKSLLNPDPARQVSEKEFRDLIAENSEQQREILNLKQELNSALDKLTDSQSTYEAKLLEIERLLHEKTEESYQKTLQIQEMENILASLEQKVIHKEEHINLLQTQLNDLPTQTRQISGKESPHDKETDKYHQLESILFASNERFNEIISRLEKTERYLPRKTNSFKAISKQNTLSSAKSTRKLKSMRPKNLTSRRKIKKI